MKSRLLKLIGRRRSRGVWRYQRGNHKFVDRGTKSTRFASGVERHWSVLYGIFYIRICFENCLHPWKIKIHAIHHGPHWPICTPVGLCASYYGSNRPNTCKQFFNKNHHHFEHYYDTTNMSIGAGLWVLIYTLKTSLQELLMMIAFLCAGMLIFSSLIYYADDRKTFTSIPHSFWWALITMTTCKQWPNGVMWLVPWQQCLV